MSATIYDFLYHNFFNLFYGVLFMPLAAALVITISPKYKLSNLGLYLATLVFWFTMGSIIIYCVVRNEFLVKSSSYELFHINSFLHKPYKIDIELGVDSISIAFLFLTAFIFYLCTFLAFESFYGDYSSTRLFYILLFSLQFFVSMAFFVMNLILFYFFFEAVLLPMYLIIIIWGSRLRKIKAAYLFFMYTMFLSFFLLYALLIIYNSVSFIFWYEELLEDTTLIFKDFYQQNFLWACFFVALAVKVPIFPLHLWLPEAHVEAPTIGSIILAGVLLKLGGYGILRFLIPVFPESTIYFRPLVLVLCLIGAVYGAFLSFLQVDIKKIVAYSSVSHMNFAVLGLFSLTVEGVVGALLLFLSHGFSSAALFHLVGVFYKRFHTRIIDYYGGLALIMPIQIFFFLFFSFANIGFPGTLNFSSEMIIFFSVVTSGVFNLPVFGLLSVPFMAGVAYSIWTFNKISFGTFTRYLDVVYDVNYFEFTVLWVLAFFTLFFGVFSQALVGFLQYDVAFIMEPYAVSS